jgi:hypothetical protein
MTKLIQTLNNWDTDSFSQTLKDEIKTIKADDLPLLKSTTQGGIVNTEKSGITILRKTETLNNIIVYIGMFFTEIVPSCSCGDDPMEANNYCEIEIKINKLNANTTFKLIDESN